MSEKELMEKIKEKLEKADAETLRMVHALLTGMGV